MIPHREHDGLVMVNQYAWDGRPQAAMHTFHYAASAWSRRVGPVLVVNLLPWIRMRKWPHSLLRFYPGLMPPAASGPSILNLWGPDWRQRSHDDRPADAGVHGAFIRAAARAVGMRSPALVVGDPAHTGLFTACGESARIYWCTDDYAAGDPARAASIRRDEAAAVAGADLVVAVSESLRARLAPAARSIVTVPNAVDPFDLRELARRRTPLAGWRDLPRPRILYVGYMNRRVDFEAVLNAAKRFPDRSFVFSGPEDPADPGVRETLPRLKALRNTLFLSGLRDRRETAQVMAWCDLGLVPYRIDDFNRACSPLKVFEYAAVGTPVLASPLPAVLPYEPWIGISDLSRLPDAIDDELARAPERKARLAGFVASHTWDVRVREVARALGDLAPGA